MSSETSALTTGSSKTPKTGLRNQHPLPPLANAPFGKTIPVFKNFASANITIKNAAQIATIVGLPEHAIAELRFSDINATGKVGFIVGQATDVELHHVRLAATSGSPISIENSSNLVLDDVSPRAAQSTTPAIAVTHSTDLVIRNSRAAADTGSFPFLTGAKTAGLVLTASDLTRAQTDVEFGKGASPQSVTRKKFTGTAPAPDGQPIARIYRPPDSRLTLRPDCMPPAPPLFS